MNAFKQLLKGAGAHASLGTWVMSALKFQADMGVLLAFMFFLNMLGAIFLLPAMATFLLKPHKKA